MTEYFWNYEVQYELSAFAGASAAEGTRTLQQRTGKYVIVTQTEGAPRPQVVSGAAAWWHWRPRPTERHGSACATRSTCS